MSENKEVWGIITGFWFFGILILWFTMGLIFVDNGWTVELTRISQIFGILLILITSLCFMRYIFLEELE